MGWEFGVLLCVAGVWWLVLVGLVVSDGGVGRGLVGYGLCKRMYNLNMLGSVLMRFRCFVVICMYKWRGSKCTYVYLLGYFRQKKTNQI